MHCPKCSSTLTSGCLSESLASQICQTCQGAWVADEDYRTWQQGRSFQGIPHVNQSHHLHEHHKVSTTDNQGALCPQCGRFLSRTKINLNPPFYLERCPSCQGLWLDHGEWEILAHLGWHGHIDLLFSQEWQNQMRQWQQQQQERKAAVEKLGPELADLLFELTEKLKNHPNGDFGAAYLMRQIATASGWEHSA